MASSITRFDIDKLDGNIVQKHGGSKQVGFKQLGVHGVQVEKRVWFEVELQGAHRNRKAEVFQVSNDDVVVAQRRLEDKQLEEKTNTECLIKGQEKKVMESMEANLGKLLKQKKVMESMEAKDVEYRLCLIVTPKVEIIIALSIKYSGNSNKMYNVALVVDGRKRLSEGDGEEKEKLIISHFGNVLSIPSGAKRSQVKS
ncbi:hypothetical protein Tco_1210280 [Tanacetum coccineum]